MRFTFLLPLLLALLLPLPGNGATDGRPGLHSSGQIFIRLQFNQNVQVSKLRDIELVVDDDMLSNGIEAMGGLGPLLFTGLIFVFALGLWLYARAMVERGVLT